MCRRHCQENDSQTAMILHHLADALPAQGRLEEAEPLAREALTLYREHPLWPAHEHQHACGVLFGILIAQKQATEAAQLIREILEVERRRPRPDQIIIASTLAQYGLGLLTIRTPEAAAHAEPFLRECVDLRRQLFPDGHPQTWLRFNAMSMLGEALVQQAVDVALSLDARLQRLHEAEPLLLDGYDAMKDDPAVPPPQQIGGADRKREALERIVRLYESWHVVEPDAGHDTQADRLRAELKQLEPVASQRAPPELSP
jgi:hypothetical protein